MTAVLVRPLAPRQGEPIDSGRKLAIRGLAVVADMTDRQRTGILFFAVVTLVVVAETMLRDRLPTVLQPALSVMLFVAGWAVLGRAERPAAPAIAAPSQAMPAVVGPFADAIDPVAPQSTPHPGPSAAPVDRAVKELGQFPIFTNILTSQMQSVVKLSDDAAQEIMGGLARVDNEVTRLMSVIRTSDAGVEVEDIVGSIETKVAACSGLLARFDARQAESRRLDDALRRHLETESQSVLRVVDGVRRLAQQSTILSFNIAIESGHLGVKNNGFAFIGDQVRKLAHDVDALAGRLDGQIGDIMRQVVVESQQAAAQREAAEAADIATLRTAIADLEGDFHTLVGHQRDVLNRVASSSEAVAAPILAMMGSVQFQDITRQHIEQSTLTVGTVGRRIAGIAAMLRDASDDDTGADLSTQLDSLFEGYVMDDQRNGHRAARGEALAAPTGQLIELF